MNERIKELAEQANDIVLLDIRGDGTLDKEVVFNKEKFAELIVQECLLCCERVISDPVSKSVDTWLNGGKQCIDEIKYHFGG